MKQMGINPADFQDPAKREALRAKFREMREKMGGAPMGGANRPRATMEVSKTARVAGKKEPGGINFAGGPIYQGNLALRPGMTANVTIMTNQKDDVLKVPAAALRFNPEAFLQAQQGAKPATPTPTAAPGQGGQGRPTGMMGGGGQGGGAAMRGMMRRREDKVWVMGPDKKPKAIVVKAGLTDGQATEISGEGISEGMEILVGVQESKKDAPKTTGTPLMGGGGPGGMPRR